MEKKLTSKAQQAKNTKNAILENSLTLFFEKGFNNVTMNDILKTTGLSKGGFYHHFESKEALFSELADTLLLSVVEIPYEDFSKQSLYSFYLDYIKYVSGNDLKSSFSLNSMNFATLIYDAIRLIPGFDERLSTIRQSEEKHWQTVVKTAKDKGEITSEMSDEMISRLFISSSKGIHYDHTMDKETHDIKAQLINLWAELYNNLK